MRVFTCPGRYRRFVEAQLALTLAEVKRDIDRRTDDDARVRNLATVPNGFIDPTEKGTLAIVTGRSESCEAIHDLLAAAHAAGA